MKNILSVVLLQLLFISVNAQNINTIKTESKINAITLYLNSAEIKQSKEIHLQKGINEIIFQNLSSSLQPQSLQVSIKDNVDILSVTTKQEKLSSDDIDPITKELIDSIKYYNKSIISIKNQINSYVIEKDVLSKNQTIGVNQAEGMVNALKKMAEYQRDRTLQINQTISELENTIETLNKRIDIIRLNIKELNKNKTTDRTEAVLVVNSANDQNINLNIRYLVDNAGWVPAYDIIAKDNVSPVELKYKAKVYNNTGINWEKVKFKFSTADPLLGATRPYLTPLNLNYNSKENEGLIDRRTVSKNEVLMTDSISTKTVDVSELSAEFETDKLNDIPCDGKPYIIEIAKYTLNATYKYLSIPKVDKDVFLIAKVTDWEKLNLIDGVANVYFADTYVGEDEINTRYIEDTLELSLGRDNRIIVTKQKKEDFASKKSLTTNRTESFMYEILVKNNRNSAITMELQDQLPISQESDITIDVNEISGAIRDLQNGKLTWDVKLGPGETSKYVISYSVKYPKSKHVNIRQFRAISCPTF